jgi:uncharacterized Zn-binding protein involved in type VI secretion
MPAAHRQGDTRVCGAATIVVGQGTTYVDGRLWAVKDDINTDGDGQLIPTGSSVFIQGKLVIVNTPDHAQMDDLCIPIGAPHCDPMTAAGSGATFAYG